MRDTRDSLTFVSGVILGAAVGGLMGVLFAPDKGEETRKKIAKKSEEMMKDLQEGVEEAKEKLGPKLESFKKEVGEKMGEVKAGFQKGVKTYRK